MADGLFGGGSGEPLNPYLIEDADDINAIRNNLNKHFKLVNDIDMATYPYDSGFGFLPIGMYWDADLKTWLFNPFTGIIDGNNHQIKNLYIHRPSFNCIGLFSGLGSEDGGVMKNIKLVDVNIVGFKRVGSLVGDIGGRCTVENCHTTGSVQGNYYDERTGPDRIGGLAGAAYMCTVRQCTFKGVVTGGQRTGGLIGDLTSASNVQATVTECYTEGSVNSNTGETGGLVGYVDYAGVSKSYSKSKVTVRERLGAPLESPKGIGGLVGNLNAVGSVSQCYALGEVSARYSDNVGGLIGFSIGASGINNNYAAGKVHGIKAVGGLIGKVFGVHIMYLNPTGRFPYIYYNHAVGEVIGAQLGSTQAPTLGGLIGTTDFEPQDTSNLNCFGLPPSALSYNYYDEYTTGCTDTGKGAGVPHEAMAIQQTFNSWDFATIWQLVNNIYPTLRFIIADAGLPGGGGT